MFCVTEDSLIKAGCVDVSTLPTDHPVSIIFEEVVEGMAARLAEDLEKDFLKKLQAEHAE